MHFMVWDSKISSPIWDFLEDQVLLDIGKTLSVGALNAGNGNERSIISVWFYKEYFLFRKKKNK